MRNNKVLKKLSLTVLIGIVGAAGAWSEVTATRDPFQYEDDAAEPDYPREDAQEDGVRRATRSVPSGIELKAMMVFENGGSIAMLKLPQRRRNVFVNENDTLSLELTDDSGEVIRYELNILKITHRGVKIAPAADPDSIHLIR